MTLQDDLDKLSGWSADWLLKFNVDKCKKMSVGTGSTYEYHVNDGIRRKALQSVDEEKDLGIVVTSDLKWDRQCSAAASKANMALGLIKRTFPYLNKEIFLALYGVYVRPHLEYCVQVWSPYYRKDINTLERVQRRATKLVNHIRNWTYEDRLHYLGLFSLERRRKRGDLIETFKILKNIDDTDSDMFFQKANTTNLRGHSLKIFKQRSTKLCRRQFLSQRVVEDWNSLPGNVVESSTVETFKKRLDKFMNSCIDEQ